MMRTLYYGIFISILLSIVSLVTPSNIFAFESFSLGDIVFSDDFSNGTLEKWEDIRNDPNGEWNVVDGQAEAFIKAGSTLAELIPKDAYWNSAWTNVSYELDYTPFEGVDRNISFHVINTRNWYEIHFVGGGFQLARLKDAKVVWSLYGSGGPPDGTPSHITIQTKDNHVRIFLNQLLLVDDLDPSFDGSGGKIGMNAGAGSVAPMRARFDNIVVRQVIDTPPPTPNPITHLIDTPLKQTDPQWSDVRYDHASLWSESESPTIGRWGCALTSAVMLLSHFGYSHMPDGSDITPLSLNQWLIDQADGYIGEGLLNWIAISRLTSILSTGQTPKLEYRRVVSDPTAPLAVPEQQLLQQLPIILQITGHFLVGDGLKIDPTTTEISDVLIRDPWYDYEHFSQHQSPLVSTRLFTPSHTDLSYLLIATDPLVQLEADHTTLDSQTQELHLESLREFSYIAPPTETGLNQPEQQFQSGATTLYEIPKPESGIYELRFTADSLSTQHLTVFGYDANGSVYDFSQDIPIGPDPITITLSLNENGWGDDSTYSLQRFARDIAHFHSQHQITKTYVLDTLLKLAESASSSAQREEIYVKAIIHYLKWYSHFISEDVRNYLEHQLRRML